MANSCFYWKNPNQLIENASYKLRLVNCDYWYFGYELFRFFQIKLKLKLKIMGSFQSIIGFLPAIAVSFSLGILFYDQYQRILFHHYMQERRQLRQQFQLMQRRMRRNMEEREEWIFLQSSRAQFCMMADLMIINSTYYIFKR